jgi:hypothetical protein
MDPNSPSQACSPGLPPRKAPPFGNLEAAVSQYIEDDEANGDASGTAGRVWPKMINLTEPHMCAIVVGLQQKPKVSQARELRFA